MLGYEKKRRGEAPDVGGFFFVLFCVVKDRHVFIVFEKDANKAEARERD